MQTQHQEPTTINWNNILVGIALLSLLSFGLLGNQKYRWLMLSLQIFGFGSAASAIAGYHHDRKNNVLYGHQRDLVETAEEVGTIYQSQIVQLQQQFAQELTTIKQNFSRQYEELEDAYESALSENQTLQHQLKQKQQWQEALLEDEREEIREERERLSQESALMWQHIEQAQDELEQAQIQIQADRTATQEAIAQREEQFQVELQAQIKEAEANLAQQEQAMQERFEQEWKEREEYYSGIASEAIAQYQASKRPDLPTGHTHEELLSRDVIRTLEQWSIIAKRPEIRPLPNQKFSLSFEVFPVLADGKIQSVIRSSAEAFKLMSKPEVLASLQGAVPGCCEHPKLQSIPNNRLQLIFDISGIDWKSLEQQKQEQEQKQLTEPNREHLLRFVKENPHINFMADSGNGKTTLINNLIAIGKQELGDSTELVGANPKPDEDTDLSTLKYIGFEESIYGLLEAATEVFYRVEVNNDIVRKNKNLPLEQRKTFPKWKPIIFFIDEYTELMGHWNSLKQDRVDELMEDFYSRTPNEKKKAVELIWKRVNPGTFGGDLTRICWRVGRSEKIKLILAGQNLKANIFKANIQDIQQQAYIYAGEAITEGIEKRLHHWHKEEIKELYAVREELAQSGKASKFYGLFVPKSGKPYVATFPCKGEYLEDSEHLENSIQNSSELLNTKSENAVPPPTSVENPHPDSHPSPPDPRTHLESCLDKDFEESHPAVPPPHDPEKSEVGNAPTSHLHPEVEAQFDPLSETISEELIEAVMLAWLNLKNQSKVIQRVWGVKKAGKSKKYRASKHHFRVILTKLNIPLATPWGNDPDDDRSIQEIIK